MRQKIFSLLLIVTLCLSGVLFNKVEVKASDGTIGTSRGIYLAEGNSSISKVSTYTMNATGVTNAALRCDVSVTVVVEKYLEDRGYWVYYTSWQTSNSNAFTASISNTIYVDLGYFYRVVSTHTAGTDTSSSFTNALWMGL